LVSTEKYSGFTVSPMHYRGGTLSDYIGITTYGWCDDGNNGICSRSGYKPKVNITENTFEVLARAKGLRIAGINEISWLQHIGAIKYNSFNWQTAVGQGIANTYKVANATVSESSVSRIIVSNADAAYFTVGNQVWISAITGTSNVVTPILSIAIYDSSNMAINVSSSYVFTTVSGTTTLNRSCEFSGETDTVLGQDGAVSTGTDGKRSILTMGIENFYGNAYKILSGICRIGSNVYINPLPDTQYAWPTSDSDAIAKGWVKFAGTYCASSGYISTFGEDASYPLILLPATIGGTSASPVGDHYDTSANATPCCLLFGGNLYYGTFAGAFYYYLSSGVGVASWYFGSLGVYIP